MSSWRPVSIAFMVIGGIGLLLSLNFEIHVLIRNSQSMTGAAGLVFGLVSAGSSAALFLLGFLSERRKPQQILQA